MSSKLSGKALIKAITEEVTSCYEAEELADFENFTAFFNDVDVTNAYEEEWKPKYYKPYYKKVFRKLRDENANNNRTPEGYEVLKESPNV